MTQPRSNVVSSFTIIKGSLIDETYAAFEHWDVDLDKQTNLHRLKEHNTIGARSANWLRDFAFVISRRFDTDGRDRVLIELARNGCDREIWKPLLLWHMTRDEFLLRDFLIHWFYPAFREGVHRLMFEDVLPYLAILEKQGRTSKAWTERTRREVAQSLLRICVDFGLLTGRKVKEFSSYHLPDESFIYLLHAMAEVEPNARRIVDAEDWRMYLMDTADVERELLRLHQFRKVHYEVAGSLAQLKLPHGSSADYARELCA